MPMRVRVMVAVVNPLAYCLNRFVDWLCDDTDPADWGDTTHEEDDR